MHNPNANSRQLTRPEQDALQAAAQLLADTEDLLTDLTNPVIPESTLSARIRVLAARSLLSEISRLRPTLDRMTNTAPVLIGKIGEDDGAVLR